MSDINTPMPSQAEMSRLETDKANKPNSKKHKKTKAPTTSPIHTHTNTPTTTPIHTHLHTHAPTAISTKPKETYEIDSKESGKNNKPSRVSDSIENNFKDEQNDDVPKPTIQPSTTYLRGSIVKDDVPEPSVIPSVSNVKDDLPEPTVVPSVSTLKDDVPEPTVVPSVSIQWGEMDFNYTVQPTYAPPNDIFRIIGDEPIPPPSPPLNYSIQSVPTSLVEVQSNYGSGSSYHGYSTFTTYYFGAMLALLVSVGLAFFYRKRFKYQRIPSGDKLSHYEFA